MPHSVSAADSTVSRTVTYSHQLEIDARNKQVAADNRLMHYY